MAFPTSIPSNTDPTATNKLSSPSHSALHQSHDAEIVAIETKIGTGASTPTSGKVLRATGTGTSAWGQTVLSTDIAAATSADLRGLLSDETGAGAAVFATAPTISSPAITTPSITTSINDSNGNEVIKTPATASAVNEITVTNAATTTNPILSATGGDSNIDLLLRGKGTGSARFSGMQDGWIDANETWTFASASTITVPTDATIRYQVGDVIKLTQSATIKYFQIQSLTSTVLTVFGLSSATVANSAITANYYAHKDAPFGYSGAWQSWTPAFTNLTIGNGTVLAKYSQTAKTTIFQIVVTLGSTSSMGTAPTFTFPVTVSSDFAINHIFGSGTANHSGNGYIIWGYLNSTTVCRFITTGTAPILANITASVPFAWTTGDFIQLTGSYEPA